MNEHETESVNQKTSVRNYSVRREQRKNNKKEWQKPMWSLGYHQNNQTVNYWNSDEEKEKMVENLFKEITAENIPHTERDLYFQVH